MERKLITAMAGFALALAFTTTAVTKALGDERSHCQERVQKAHDHFRREVHEHGRNSRQAEEARARMNNEWERCWTGAHGWYDPERREWRTDRDWDRNYDWDHDRDDRDHDRDHDRDDNH